MTDTKHLAIGVRWRAFLAALLVVPAFGVVSIVIGFLFVPSGVENPLIRLLFGGLSGLVSVIVMLAIAAIFPAVFANGDDERLLVLTLPTVYVAIQFVLQTLIIGSPFGPLTALGRDPGAGWGSKAPWAVVWLGCFGWMAVIRLLARLGRNDSSPVE